MGHKEGGQVHVRLTHRDSRPAPTHPDCPIQHVFFSGLRLWSQLLRWQRFLYRGLTEKERVSK